MAFANAAGQSLKFEKTPTDTISCIACNGNPASQIVCCTSWDNSLTGKVCQIAYGQKNISVIGFHSGIVSGVCWCPNQGLVLSGSSYDFNLNFWDRRDNTKPANSINLQAKCKFLDVANDKAIIVTSDNKISQYDLKQTDKKLKTFSSKISCPISSLAITPDGNGYVVGGLYGILEANMKGTGADLIPCHREFSQKPEAAAEVYSSNCVAIGCVQSKNIFISGGGNGSIEYFSADTLANTDKKKLKADPITACCIIPQQNTYVVATGNDWSRGADASNGAPQTEMTIRMFNGKQIGQ